MSDSLWPHGLQHTRLSCPSPFPGACSNSCPLNRWCHPTNLSSVIPFSSCLQSFPASGCAVLCLVAQSSPTLCNPMDSLGSSMHGDFPGKNTWVVCYALLQEIFPTQGLNPDLPHCRWILYHLIYQGSPGWMCKLVNRRVVISSRESERTEL